MSPTGVVVAGPVYDAEAIVFADCDLRETLHAKRYFDVVGHYGRTDVLGVHTLKDVPGSWQLPAVDR